MKCERQDHKAKRRGPPQSKAGCARGNAKTGGPPLLRRTGTAGRCGPSRRRIGDAKNAPHSIKCNGGRSGAGLTRRQWRGGFAGLRGDAVH